MNIYIPIVEGQVLAEGVEKSILNQSLSCKINLVYGKGKLETHRRYTPTRIIEEAKCREDCRCRALYDGGSYSVIQDRDCKHLNDENILDMMSFLQNNPSHGAVSIGLNYGDLSHVSLICVMFRWSVLVNLRFENRYGKCLCREVTEDIRKMRYKYGYLDGKRRIVEVNK